MGNKIKVLSLPDLTNIYSFFYYEDCGYKEISPVFNRNGRYFDREKKIVWQEYNGRAFLENRIDDFVYELNLLTVKLLDKDELAAFRFLRKSRLLPKSMKKTLELNENIIMLRDVVFTAGKSGMRAEKRFEEFKTKVEQRDSELNING